MEQNRKKIGFGLYSLLFMTIGSFLLYFSYESYNIVNASKTWPKTKGKILSSYINTRKDDDNDAPVFFDTKIVYEYIIDEEIFESDKVFVSYRSSFFRSTQEKIVSEFPKGKIVEVSYDPLNKTYALLKPGKMRYVIFEIIYGCLSIFFGIYLFAKMFYSNDKIYKKFNYANKRF